MRINSKLNIRADEEPIFVTGVWKSGNHLVYSALNKMGVCGPLNGIAAHLLFGRFSWAKKLIRGSRYGEPGLQIGLETNATVGSRYIDSQLTKFRGCILGGHAAYSDALLKLLNMHNTRIVCVRRDPRDILVSFADWIGDRSDFYLHPDFRWLSREQRIRFLLNGGQTRSGYLVPFPEVLSRGAGWLKADGVLQISFEELVGSSGGGTDVTQKIALHAIHKHVQAPVPIDLVEPGSIYGNTLTFNQGRSQRWKELTDLKLRREIDETLAPHMDIWGYEY